MPVVTAVLLSVTMITRAVKVAGEGDISEQSWEGGHHSISQMGTVRPPEAKWLTGQ